MTNSEIQIRIIGKIGNENLTPANFDIAQIKVLLSMCSEPHCKGSS